MDTVYTNIGYIMGFIGGLEETNISKSALTRIKAIRAYVELLESTIRDNEGRDKLEELRGR